MDRNMKPRMQADQNHVDRTAKGRSQRGSLVRRVSLAILIASVTGAAHAGDGSSSSRVWQPRPLALPPTSATAPAWKPPTPQPAAVAPSPPPVTIIMTAPVPAEEPTTITRRRKTHSTDSATASLGRTEQTYSRPMPASDPINHHARTAELAQSAVDQLRRAHFAARRGAFHTAKESATQTLRIIASLRDSQTGGNLHTTQLNEAITAIRESTDFTGRYGPVDQAALNRLVEVHKTPALHGVNTSALTAERAIEAYLNYARQRWVEATMDGPLAAEATMILADLESATLTPQANSDVTEARSRLHASELALMYRRAAVEIGPDNPQATAELGRNLLRRSMPAIAKELLLLSVQQKPTRQSVEDLMRAASQSGDTQLAAECQQQLASTNLPSELPVQVLSPSQFAKTNQQFATVNHTPNPATSGPSNVRANQSAPPAYLQTASRPNSRDSIGQGHLIVPAQNGRAMQSRIVDPSMPAAPARSTTPRSGLFW
ncbi:MAG: tetratricopeptide repeat protein [Rhodopirellula sp. JB055]|uniref:tetratricopeptide repeat protein n=1 Tax=Rhodopirellula sp. JB055 TaxID=3342846 RepID=UPI00370B87FC